MTLVEMHIEDAFKTYGFTQVKKDLYRYSTKHVQLDVQSSSIGNKWFATLSVVGRKEISTVWLNGSACERPHKAVRALINWSIEMLGKYALGDPRAVC